MEFGDFPKIKKPSAAGFEPARGNPNRFQVYRLNHSAKLIHTVVRGDRSVIGQYANNNLKYYCIFLTQELCGEICLKEIKNNKILKKKE